MPIRLAGKAKAINLFKTCAGIELERYCAAYVVGHPHPGRAAGIRCDGDAGHRSNYPRRKSLGKNTAQGKNTIFKKANNPFSDRTGTSQIVDAVVDSMISEYGAAEGAERQ